MEVLVLEPTMHYWPATNQSFVELRCRLIKI